MIRLLVAGVLYRAVLAQHARYRRSRFFRTVPSLDISWQCTQALENLLRVMEDCHA